jgi:predicted DsbA family dithiol-disulfide isomerase
MSVSSQPALRVDVISDVVCPWCYIGKRRLEAALAGLSADKRAVAVVRWHPFELNPDLPPEGIDRRAYLEAKFGGPARASGIYARVAAAGASDGIAFDFDRIVRQPNTRDAHRLIGWAQEQGDASMLVERLFAAYFCEGRSLADRATLADIAASAGLDRGAALAQLQSDDGLTQILAAERRAHEIGVTGVPFFIFDGKVGVSGAQSAEVLLQAIAEAQGEAATA